MGKKKKKKKKETEEEEETELGARRPFSRVPFDFLSLFFRRFSLALVRCSTRSTSGRRQRNAVTAVVPSCT